MRRGRPCFNGHFRHFATFRAASLTTDGETKPTWSDFATGVPCSRRQNGGRETINDNSVLALADETIVIHYRPDITAQMRITFATTGGGKDVLEIKGLGDQDGDRMWLKIQANRLEST